MENEQAVLALAALAQGTRIEAFRTLVKHEPEGLAAGDLARLLEVPQNTLSAHLTILARAGLVVGERRSRSIVYRAEITALQEVVVFMLQDCCGGRPEFCAPVIEQLSACCAPAKPKAKTKERSRA